MSLCYKNEVEDEFIVMKKKTYQIFFQQCVQLAIYFLIFVDLRAVKCVVLSILKKMVWCIRAM